MDTPGIHQAKNRLGEFMVEAAERTLKEADLVMWLVEPVTYIGAGEQHILEKLQEVKTPVILVSDFEELKEKIIVTRIGR